MAAPLKIALVNPPALAVVEPWYDTPAWGRAALAYLAAYLRERADHEITVIDAKLERLDFRQTLERIVAVAPDVVGFTAFTNEIKPAAYQAALVKERLPAAVTVIGGVHVTALPRETLTEFPSFDVGVVGEGEVTFVELCDALPSRRPLAGVAGLVYRDGGSDDGGAAIVETAARPRMLDQDAIPYPAWDLFPPMGAFYVQTLRGCPFRCVFCMNPNGRVARTRSVDNVMGELEMLVERHGARSLRFGDELFTVDMERSRAMMDAMIARGLGEKLEWHCQTHVRFVDEDLLAKMKRAGCTRVELGVETGDESKLRTLGKGTNVEMILRAAEAARAASIPFGTFFIIGQPNETRASIQKTIDLAVEMNPDLPMFGIMCPYPGTEVSRMAAEGEGGFRLLTTDWDEYNKQIGGALEFASLTRSQIERIQLLAYVKVFVWNRRFGDFVRFAWEYRRAAFKAAAKALLRRSIDASIAKPADYERKIASAGGVTTDELVCARQAWEEVQKAELVSARAGAPRLLEAMHGR